MVYLTCAVIGLGGRGVIKIWTEVAARVRLYMLTSDLTSLVPPAIQTLAASEDSWHRLFFYIYGSQFLILIIFFYRHELKAP